MSDAALVALISSVSALVAALSWPIIVLFLVMRFHRQIAALTRPFARSLQDRLESGGGGEASIAFAGVSFRGKIDAASVLVAEASAQPGVAGGRVTTAEARRGLTGVIHSELAAASVESSAVLWVDDRPENNSYVVDAFRKLGIAVTLVLSSRQAIDLLEINAFDVIVSDMGRQESDSYHERAGYELLSQVRHTGSTTPFFIYAGSNLREHKEEARRRGAQGSTNRPAELMTLVISALANVGETD